MRKAFIILISFGYIFSTGCSWLPKPYKIDVQQGNVISQESLNLLKPGMPKRKVRFVMGTPLIIDGFHQNRWDYFYSLETGGELQKTEHLALYFQDDKLQKIEGDMRPREESEKTALQHQQETIVLIHPTIKEKSWFVKLLDKIGLGEDEYDVTGNTQSVDATPHTH
jgi:outer membrane protein assembly factor BamE